MYSEVQVDPACKSLREELHLIGIDTVGADNNAGSVAKFFNRQKGKLCTIKFYTIASNRCNSLYVEKTKFGRKLRFRLYIA